MRGFQQRMEVTRFLELIRERIPVGGAPAAEPETLSLADAAGRVLAHPIVSEINVPGFVRSAMDGYAVRSEETFGAGPYNPLAFKVIGEVTPGREFPGRGAASCGCPASQFADRASFRTCAKIL